MSKFTKGKWKYETTETVSNKNWYRITDEEGLIAVCTRNKYFARLIAAAPEMYELLDEIQKGYLEYGTIADWHCDKIFNILVRIDGEKV